MLIFKMFNLQKLKEKKTWKQIFSAMWQFLVYLAYAKFYIFCLTIGGMVLFLTVFVFEEHGIDSSVILKSIKPMMYSVLSYITIILIDKIWKGYKINTFGKGK